MTSVFSEFPVLDEIPRVDDESEEEVVDDDKEDDVEAVFAVSVEEFKHCCNFFNCVSIVSIRSRKLSESCKINKIIDEFYEFQGFWNFIDVER